MTPLEYQTRRADALAATVRALRDLVTTDHESKDSFIDRVTFVLRKDPDERLAEMSHGGSLIPRELEGDTIICAVRYALGRQTYVTSDMQSVVKHAWVKLTPRVRAVIIRDITEARDNDRLGNPRIDAPGWLEILELPDPTKNGNDHVA